MRASATACHAGLRAFRAAVGLRSRPFSCRSSGLKIRALPSSMIARSQGRNFSSSTVVGDSAKDSDRQGMSFIEKASVAGVNALLGKFIHKPGRFDSAISGLKVTSFSSGNVTCSLTVEEKLQNPYSTLHGGAAATLVDIVGTLALLTLDPTRPGVSVDLNVSYLIAAKSGEELEITGR